MNKLTCLHADQGSVRCICDSTVHTCRRKCMTKRDHNLFRPVVRNICFISLSGCSTPGLLLSVHLATLLSQELSRGVTSNSARMPDESPPQSLAVMELCFWVYRKTSIFAHLSLCSRKHLLVQYLSLVQPIPLKCCEVEISTACPDSQRLIWAGLPSGRPCPRWSWQFHAGPWAFHSGLSPLQSSISKLIQCDEHEYQSADQALINFNVWQSCLPLQVQNLSSLTASRSNGATHHGHQSEMYSTVPFDWAASTKWLPAGPKSTWDAHRHFFRMSAPVPCTSWVA